MSQEAIYAEISGRDTVEAVVDDFSDRVRGANADDAVLTAHQREALEAAIDAGYYEQPRDTSLTDLAAELDVAKSTLSGVLRRAEAALSRAYVDDATR